MGQTSDIMTCTKPNVEREESTDSPEARTEKNAATSLALVDPTEAIVIIEEDPEALRDQIEQTRTEMSETLDAIKTKLDPHLMMEEAKDKVSTVTKEKAAQALHFAKRHPVPVGIAGALLGWLCVRSWSKRRRRNVV